MADRIYGLDRGEEQTKVAEGSSSPTKDVEVVVDLAQSLTKNEVIRLLTRISDHIVTDDFPPA